VEAEVAPKPPSPSGALRKGSNGPQVALAQAQLNDLGAAPQLEADGRFGAKTEAAVKTFQASHQLRADGVIGDLTSTMLANEHALHAEDAGAEPCHTPADPGPDEAFDEAGGGGPSEVTLGVNDLVGQEKGAERVVVKLTNDVSPEKTASDLAEMAAFGGVQETAVTVAALQAVLARHPNISTLALLSHGTPDGKIFVGNTLISLAALAAQLQQRGAGSVGSIVFLGCSVGNDKTGLGEIKKKAGAKDSQGVNCNMQTISSRPVPDGNGVPLPSVNAIIKAGSQDPVAAIKKQAKVSMKKDRRTGCIIGFPAGVETIESVTDEKIKALYDKNKGFLTAKFTSNVCETCFEALVFDPPDDCGCKKVQA
jgi:peptidoglycan hydrolase-like protein with peptidoglycan-binding domain